LGSAEANRRGKYNVKCILRLKSDVIKDRPFVARMQLQTHDIELCPRSTQLYTTKSPIAALQKFSQQLLSLTKIVEYIFKVFPKKEYEIYTTAYDTINGKQKTLS